MIIFGEQEPETIAQMEKVLTFGGEHAVLCADAHLGYSVPVGGVIAYEGKINVNGVGYDIACGNKAVRLDCSAEEVRSNIYRNMNEIQKHISFGIGRKNGELVESSLFDDVVWNDVPILSTLKDKASQQLGTVGSGNHYVDLFVDESDRVWCGVHFGSRGLGHSIATYFVKAGGGVDGIHADPVLFDVASDLGQQYLTCMELAGRYAYAGRDWVCERVEKILRANIVEEVHNHHNFAWKEQHFGKDLWVIRKGSTPAFPGQRGFIGGSMGDLSFIISGVESESSRSSMYSTIHGAGRKMGRTAAKGKKGKPGLVDKDKHNEWMKDLGVELRGGDLDESPYAYKRIGEVLGYHSSTIEVQEILRPIGVVMADSRERDPYKD